MVGSRLVRRPPSPVEPAPSTLQRGLEGATTTTTTTIRASATLLFTALFVNRPDHTHVTQWKKYVMWKEAASFQLPQKALKGRRGATSRLKSMDAWLLPGMYWCVSHVQLGESFMAAVHSACCRRQAASGSRVHQRSKRVTFHKGVRHAQHLCRQGRSARTTGRKARLRHQGMPRRPVWTPRHDMGRSSQSTSPSWDSEAAGIQAPAACSRAPRASPFATLCIAVSWAPSSCPSYVADGQCGDGSSCAAHSIGAPKCRSM